MNTRWIKRIAQRAIWLNEGTVTIVLDHAYSPNGMYAQMQPMQVYYPVRRGTV